MQQTQDPTFFAFSPLFLPSHQRPPFPSPIPDPPPKKMTTKNATARKTKKKRRFLGDTTPTPHPRTPKHGEATSGGLVLQGSTNMRMSMVLSLPLFVFPCSFAGPVVRAELPFLFLECNTVHHRVTSFLAVSHVDPSPSPEEEAPHHLVSVQLQRHRSS